MALSSLMSIAVRAMTAQQMAINVTGHNIANANVAGYSRQKVELATAPGQYTGAGFLGKGVDVETISRSHDIFLSREASATRSIAAMDAVRLTKLQQLERAFPTGEKGLGFVTQQFLNALSDLASRPSDSAARQVVLAQAQEMATRFTGAQTQVETLQRAVTEELGVAAGQVNDLTRSIAKINQQIATIVGSGQPPNDLLDERDRLVSRLSEQIRVTTLAADDGTLTVFAASGQQLVLGRNAYELSVVPNAFDSTRSALAVLDNGIARQLPTDQLGGGRIAGLLQFQDRDLVQARALIGQMAAAVGGAVNAQQRLGMNLHEPIGSVLPADIFAMGGPRTLPATTNARGPGGDFLGSINLTVTRPAELQASEYGLRADPAVPGNWLLTRHSDGLVRSIADGDEVDGFRVDVGVPAPAAGDQFLLQPVSQAGFMKSLMTDPRDLAAASPLTVTLGSTNTGSAAVAAFRVTDPSVNPQHRASITFTDDSGSYSWDLRDRTTNALISSGSGVWVAGQPIPPASGPAINGFSLELSGVPLSGDSLTVDLTPNPRADNGNALALAALRDLRLVGLERLPSGALVGGATLTDAYAGAIADIGVRTQSAATLSSISSTLAVQVETERTAATGVNLDEEAARLIEFQQSYQAAAKALQVAQSVFDTLLQVTAR